MPERTVKSPAKSTAKSTATRQRFVDEALRLFKDQGYEQTSMAQIAAAAGGSRANLYLYFRSKPQIVMARMREIEAEIVPGILPVSNVAQTRKFAGQCGAAIPAWMDGVFEGLDDKPAARQLIAATIAAELCGQLYAGGVRHFHFYTLNRAELAYAICHLLGLRAEIAK